MTTRFELITPDGTIDLLGRLDDGADPVLTRRLDFDGLALVVMDHDFELVELPDKTFQLYLEEERLDDIARIRKARGAKPVEIERYARSMKSLVRVGQSRETARRIEDGDLRFLVGMSSVTALDLRGTAISDRGVAHLAKLSGLRTLDLGDTAITDAALAHLGGLTNLESLNLEGTAITDAGLGALAELPKLEILRLAGTRVSAQSADSAPVRMPVMQLLHGRIDLELLHNPYLLDPGDSIEVRVLFEGAPLRDTTVWAYHGEGGNLAERIEGRTDGRGVARFELGSAGFWLIRLVHMRACAEWDDVDWESFWAAYSFELD